jgi:hypothetical protein
VDTENLQKVVAKDFAANREKKTRVKLKARIKTAA